MGAPRTFPLIYKILTDNPGKVIRVNTIAKATRLTEQQVRSAISDWRRRNEVHRNTIHVMYPGQAWMFKDVDANVAPVNGHQSAEVVAGTEPVEEATVAVTPPQAEESNVSVDSITAVNSAGKKSRANVHGVCTGDLLECVGFSGGNSALVLRSADGQLFTAKPL